MLQKVWGVLCSILKKTNTASDGGRIEMMASLMHLRIRNREMAFGENKNACNYSAKLLSTFQNA
jgi:hypothetical protein